MTDSSKPVTNDQATPETPAAVAEPVTAKTDTEAESTTTVAASADTTTAKSGSAVSMIIILFLGLIILLFIIILCILGFFLIKNSNQSNNEPTPTPTVTVTETPTTSEIPTTETPSETPTAVVKQIKVTTPQANSGVNGKIAISGESTLSLGNIKVRVYDLDGIKIGEKTVTVTGTTDALIPWSSTVDVTKSPSRSSGYLRFFPAGQAEDSTYRKQVNVTFPAMVSANRVKLNAPLKNQRMTANWVVFWGEMKDFFEATMSVRLKKSDGTVLYNSGISAQSDNYGKWAKFVKTIQVNNLPSSGTGTWELYEVSQADGSTNIFVTVPVRFGN